MILILLYALIYPALDAYHDHLVVTESKDWHAVKAAMFVFNIVMISFAAFGQLFAYPGTIEQFFAYMGKMLFVLLSCRWIIFDMAFNIFAGNPLLYVGHTAWMDRNIPQIIQLCLKVLFLVASIFLIIELFYV